MCVNGNGYGWGESNGHGDVKGCVSSNGDVGDDCDGSGCGS
jgi:hypothetical protein